MDGWIVQQNPVRALAMLAKSLAMIGRHCDQRAVIETCGFQGGEELAQHRIGISDLRIVRVGYLRFVRLRRVVGIVRVIHMHPQKERAALGPALLKPVLRSIDYVARTALDRLIAVFARLLSVEPRIIHVESAFKTGRHVSRWIEHYGAYEGRSPVALPAEQVGQIWRGLFQSHTEVVDMVVLRISPRQDRRMRRRRQRNVRVCAREHSRLFGQRIEIWSHTTIRSEKPHAVGTRGVESDKDDIRLGLRLFRCLCRADGCDQVQKKEAEQPMTTVHRPEKASLTQPDFLMPDALQYGYKSAWRCIGATDRM